MQWFGRQWYPFTVPQLTPCSLANVEAYLGPCQTSVVKGFLRKKLMAKSCELFSQKSSIIDVLQGSGYAFVMFKCLGSNFLSSPTVQLNNDMNEENHVQRKIIKSGLMFRNYLSMPLSCFILHIFFLRYKIIRQIQVILTFTIVFNHSVFFVRRQNFPRISNHLIWL